MATYIILFMVYIVVYIHIFIHTRAHYTIRIYTPQRNRIKSHHTGSEHTPTTAAVVVAVCVYDNIILLFSSVLVPNINIPFRHSWNTLLSTSTLSLSLSLLWCSRIIYSYFVYQPTILLPLGDVTPSGSWDSGISVYIHIYIYRTTAVRTKQNSLLLLCYDTYHTGPPRSKPQLLPYPIVVPPLLITTFVVHQDILRNKVHPQQQQSVLCEGT